MLISKLLIINNDNQRLIVSIIVSALVLFASYIKTSNNLFSISFISTKNSVFQKEAAENLGNPTIESISDSMDTPEILLVKSSKIKLFIRNKKTATNIKVVEKQQEAEPITDNLTTTLAAPSVAERGAYSMSEIREKLLIEISPIYSYLARERLLEGTVILQLKVNPGGSVKTVDVIKSSGHSLLDYDALSATKKWIFKPDNQISTIKKYTVEIEFVLEE